MLHNAALLVAISSLFHSTSAEPRPPPGRPDRGQSHPCFPGDRDTVGGNADESLPPCIRQAKIMQACGIWDNGQNLTSSEMRQCVCDGSFFEDNIGCGACLSYQELISGDEYDERNSVISSVSSAYCNGDEAVGLDTILNDATATFTIDNKWTSGASITTTKPTAVSNYFTATADQQGPGLESLVTDRTLTGEAPTAEPTDDAAVTLVTMGLPESLCFVGAVAILLSI